MLFVATSPISSSSAHRRSLTICTDASFVAPNLIPLCANTPQKSIDHLPSPQPSPSSIACSPPHFLSDAAHRRVSQQIGQEGTFSAQPQHPPRIVLPVVGLELTCGEDGRAASFDSPFSFTDVRLARIHKNSCASIVINERQKGVPPPASDLRHHVKDGTGEDDRPTRRRFKATRVVLGETHLTTIEIPIQIYRYSEPPMGYQPRCIVSMSGEVTAVFCIVTPDQVAIHPRDLHKEELLDFG